MNSFAGSENFGPAGRGGQCDNFWVVLQFFERYLAIHFEKADFYSELRDINFVPWSARPSRVIFSTSSLEGTDFMLTPKKSQLEVFVEKLPEAPALMLSFLTDSRSSTRFPAVTRLTVHRRRQFGRRVELVGRPDQKRQCVNLGSVFETLCKIWQFVFRKRIFLTYSKLWRTCW